MRTAAEGARALAAALADEGGSLAVALADEGGSLAEVSAPLRPEPPRGVRAHGGALSDPGPAQIAAAGPRAAGHEAEYELLLEMILEGARLHYGIPRVIRPSDPDLALLLGDQLYALGLGRLAALGDLDAVAELADVISLVSQAGAASDHELTRAVWHAGAVAIGWGSSPEHEAAKAAARDEDPGASARLVAAAEVQRSRGEEVTSAGRRSELDDTLISGFDPDA